MSGNTFGRLFRLTTFGESHGPALGGVVDGCPPGVALDEARIQAGLDRRKPGQGPASTARKEPDRVRLLSGVFEGLTTGTPIGFVIENTDQRSRDYSAIKDLYRPGHADFTYQAKYGRRDYRGGGRASARETAARVAGGEVARALLEGVGVSVYSYTLEFGDIPCAVVVDAKNARTRPFYAPDDSIVDLWDDRVRQVKAEGDSIGGVVGVTAAGVPVGLGEPVFDKLDARLAYALMGIGAVKGVEIGGGLASARAYGSKNNDALTPGGGFETNFAGGVLGGISSGQDITARVAVKPIPSVGKEQRTVTTADEPATLRVPGRHDVCAIPRINPVIEAMVLLTLADFWLLARRGL